LPSSNLCLSRNLQLWPISPKTLALDWLHSIPNLVQTGCFSNALHSGGTSQQGKQVTLFGDIVEKVCCHPAYRLLSLRALPQMPPASLDFTTFTWPAILRRLRQMQITGTHLPPINTNLLGSSCHVKHIE